MSILIAGLILLILLGYEVWKEPRQFFNAVLLLTALFCMLLGIVKITSRYEYIRSFCFAAAFGFVPLILLFMAVLLMVNAVVMLKKEGLLFKNLLSLFVWGAIIIGVAVTALALFTVTDNTLLMSVLWLGAIGASCFVV